MAKIVSDLLQIFRSSVSAVLPDKLIKNSMKYNNSTEQLTIAGDNFNLLNKNVYLVGFGKAVQYMAKEVENILSAKIKQGILSIPEGSLNLNLINRNVFYYEGAKYNMPDKNAESTAVKVKNLISNLTFDDFLIVLISGGGSALLPLPQEPITLNEKTQLVKDLANAGANIIELNTVRKRISDVKGGQLAIKAQPSQVVSLVLSDIVGDPLDLIASGPTTENRDSPDAALKILEKFNLYDQAPESIKTVIKEYNEAKSFPNSKVKNYIIGSNRISINKALVEAKILGYFPIGLSCTVTGNVRNIAHEYVKLCKIFCSFIEGHFDKVILKRHLSLLNIPGVSTNFINDTEFQTVDKNICLVLGGEITVEVKGSGKGGRNQHLALEFSTLIHQIKDDFTNFDVYLLSAGTDGIDGPTDAAGAIGYIDLVSDTEKLNIDVNRYLSNNDSYNFYKLFKNGKLHVITGHTNTNVMDIHLIIIQKKINAKL